MGRRPAIPPSPHAAAPAPARARPASSRRCGTAAAACTAATAPAPARGTASPASTPPAQRTDTGPRKAAPPATRQPPCTRRPASGSRSPAAAVTAPTSRSGRSSARSRPSLPPRRLVLPLPRRFHVLLTRPSAAEPIGALPVRRAGLLVRPRVLLILRVTHRLFRVRLLHQSAPLLCLYGNAPRGMPLCRQIATTPIAPLRCRPPAIPGALAPGPAHQRRVSAALSVFYIPRATALTAPNGPHCQPATTQTRRRNQ